MLKLICDKIDEELIPQHTWYNHQEGYVRAQETHASAKLAKRKSRKWIHFSREVMKRVLNRELLDTEFVDHINGIIHDNRRENLRIVTKAQNCRNRKKHKTNTCGYKGVIRCGNKFGAGIMFNYKRYHLGNFDTPEEAYKAYCEASIKFHGEYGKH